MEEKKYYIVNMLRHDQIFLLWGKNFAGYTTDETKAGRYTIEEVQEKYGGKFPIVKKYNDLYECWEGETDNFLIPADEEKLEKIGLRKVTVITFS